MPSEESRLGGGASAELATYEAHGDRGVLRLDDGKANAIGSHWCDVVNALLDANEHDATRTLTVVGRSGFFSAGLDLGVLPTLAPDELQRTTHRFMQTMRRLFLHPKPMIAASTGHAIAGGMMLYLCADIRLALRDPRARYGLNEATTGIPLLGGTAGICSYSIPREHHTELILHGRLIDAQGTLARGITHAICDDSDQLMADAEARARSIADVEPEAYRTNKLILRERAYEEAVEAAERYADRAPSGNVFGAIRRWP